METRLTLYSANLKEKLKTAEDAKLQGTKEALQSAKVSLELSTKVFVEEIRQYCSSKKPSEELITEYTNLQLLCEKALTELMLKDQDIRNHTINGDKTNSKLPKLSLPTYNGQLLKWHEFWDQFSSSVHEKHIPDVDKLTFLKMSLKGEAKDKIKGLDTTAKNYEIDVKLLTDHYGRPGLLVDAHYKELYNVTRKGDSMKECRRVLNEIERHLRVLTSLGESNEGAHLRGLIIGKFPDDLVYELRSKMNSDQDSVTNIRNYLEAIVSSKEVAYKGNEDFIPIEEETRNVSSVSMLHTRVGRKRQNKETRHQVGPKRPRKECVFCKGQHFNDECDKYRTVHERKGKLGSRCFNCFKLGHAVKNCTFKRPCYYCKQSHNRALCDNQFTNYRANTDKPGTVLQTAIVFTKHNDGSKMKCRLLLDCGSQRSYVSKQFAELSRPDIIENDYLMIYTFGQNLPKKLDSPRALITLISSNGSARDIHVNIVPYITSEIMPFNYSDYDIKKPAIMLADDGSMGGEIDILIGNDYYFSVIKDKKISAGPHLYLIETEFGWVWSGQAYNKTKHVTSVLTYVQTSLPDNLGLVSPDLPLRENDAKQLWDLESIGIKDSPGSTKEEEVVKHFNKNIKFDGVRYYVKWPRTQFPPNLPTNYNLAVARLASLIKRTDTDVLKTYNQVIKEQDSTGIITKVVDPFQKMPHPVHYLPHHCVQKKDGTTNLRVVYDASAKLGTTCASLNECLYKGPLMLEDLNGLLIKFRQGKIGIIADVEKAFLMIGLQNDDQDVTRFLWLKDWTKEICKENLICYRFCRVPFGIISSPFLLTATIRYHLMKQKNNILQKVAQNIYVDNLVTTVDTEIDSIELYHRTNQSLQEMSMNIRQWNSNSKEFTSSLPKNKREDKHKTKVLGLLWNTANDTLQIQSVTKIPENKQEKITKRIVLRDIASVYDPCGFGAPIMLPAKLFLQDLWKLKLKWDSPIPQQQASTWKRIKESMKILDQLTIPRYIGFSGEESRKNIYELHCFSDASTRAYAATVYLRCISPDGKVKVSLIMAKSRLTPLKDKDNLQIPRLELLGVLIGSRLVRYVMKNMDVPITRLCLWTDSQVVISWTKSIKLLPPFIANRINEIKGKGDIQFLYVKTNENPADIATRAEVFTKKDLWFNGPNFLMQSNTNYTDNWAFTNTFCIAEGLTESEIETNSYGQDTETERELIEDKIRKEQQLYYPQEYSGNKTDTARSLGIFKDDENILRCTGRTTLADLSFGQKYPILLHKKSTLTGEIIRNIHEKNYHVGVTQTLSLVRQKYWIPQGRSTVQRELNKCYVCKKYGGGPYRLPEMPQLPEERVNFQKAFSFVGLDYLGPILVRDKSRQIEKRWICLYTCLAIRAVHLEIVKDLSAEECTLALRRFIACRAMPSLIISDNATQFKLTAQVMSGEYCIANKLIWKFIPELAPWHGGFYERLVGLVKQCLKKTLDKFMLYDNQLSTIVKEVELVLNTRPLTYVSSEIEHILKPQDFLCLNECLTDPTDKPYLAQSDTETKKSLIEGWQRGQRLIKEFSKLFVDQYLMNLKERKQVTHKQPRIVSKNSPKVGDIVQIKGDNNNRSLWRVGKIVSLAKGKDEEVRVATVRIGEKEFVRSIAHLYPLEIEEQSCSSTTDSPESLVDKPVTEMSAGSVMENDQRGEIELQRVGRAAALKAKEKISHWTKELVNMIVS